MRALGKSRERTRVPRPALEFLRPLIILAAVSLLAACSPSPKESILGEWKAADGSGFEFLEGGTAVMLAPLGRATISWRMPSDDVLQLILNGLIVGHKLRFHGEDTMELVMELDGTKEVFKRVKD